MWACVLIFFLISVKTTNTASTTVTTTTTQSRVTITIPLWVIYAIVIPVVCIATIVALIALIRWICKKREASVSPINELEDTRRVKDLKNDKAQEEVKQDPFENFVVVSDESHNLSKEPKKAVISFKKEDLENTASILETKPCNSTKKIKKEQQIKEVKSRKEILDSNFISENTFNHLKEELQPAVYCKQVSSTKIRKPQCHSMNNTLNLKNETKKSLKMTKLDSRRTLISRRQRKPKQSTRKRNLNLIKSKMSRQGVEDTDDTSSDTNTSTVPVMTDEESIFDTSILHRRDEDFITDDEDSASDATNMRSPYNRTLANNVMTENQRKDITKTIHEQVKNIPDFSGLEMPTQVDECNEYTKDMNTDKGNLYISLLNNFDTGSSDRTLQKITKSRLLAVNLKSENDSSYKTENYADAKFIDAGTKTVDTMKIDNVPREGPIASSSFKAFDNEKSKFKNKKTNLVNEANIICDLGLDKEGQKESLTERNNQNFKEAVTIRSGRINLNRSISLNEGEQFKYAIESKRRKRKYHSLRHARKESVFEALKTLEKSPKRGILKKSDSLKFSKSRNKVYENIENCKLSPGQLLRHENRSQNTNVINDKDEHKISEDFEIDCSRQSDSTHICDILSSNLRTTTGMVDSNKRPLHIQKLSENPSEMFIQDRIQMVLQIPVQNNTTLYDEQLSESDNEDQDINNDAKCEEEKSELLSHGKRSDSVKKVYQNIDNIIGKKDGSIAQDSEKMGNSSESKLKCTSISQTISDFDQTSCNHQENIPINQESLLIFKTLEKEINFENKIASHARAETYENACRFERNKMHSQEPDNDHDYHSIYISKAYENEKNNKVILRQSEECDRDLQLNKIHSPSPAIDVVGSNFNGDSVTKQSLIQNGNISNANGMRYCNKEILKEEHLSDLSETTNIDLKSTERSYSELKYNESICTDFGYITHSRGENKKQTLSSINQEKPTTSQLTSFGMTRLPCRNNTTKLLDKVTRHKSTPSFDLAHVDLLQTKNNQKGKSQPKQSSLSKPLSPIENKDITCLPQNIAFIPPKLSGYHKTKEQVIGDTQYFTATSNEQLYADGKNNYTHVEMELPNNEFFIPTAKAEFSKMNNVKPTCEVVLNPINMKNNCIFEENASEKKLFAAIYPSGSNECNEEYEIKQSPLFNVKNYDMRLRSKTPPVELDRVSWNRHGLKRSETPMPEPTFFKNQYEGSIPKPLRTNQLSKLKTGYRKNANMDTFSRNFPLVREEKQAEIRFPNRNIPDFRNEIPKEPTLLYKREKDQNLLNGRKESKRAVEKVRPKSAMSMRSAPRLTSQDNETHISRKVRTEVKFRPYSGECRRPITPSLLHWDISHGNKLHVKAHYTPDFRQKRYDLNESDSELEAFFENPDIESLQFGSEDLRRNGFDGNHKTVFSTFSKRNDLAKSRSFKI